MLPNSSASCCLLADPLGASMAAAAPAHLRGTDPDRGGRDHRRPWHDQPVCRHPFRRHLRRFTGRSREPYGDAGRRLGLPRLGDRQHRLGYRSSICMVAAADPDPARPDRGSGGRLCCAATSDRPTNPVGLQRLRGGYRRRWHSVLPCAGYRGHPGGRPRGPEPGPVRGGLAPRTCLRPVRNAKRGAADCRCSNHGPDGRRRARLRDARGVACSRGRGADPRAPTASAATSSCGTRNDARPWRGSLSAPGDSRPRWHRAPRMRSQLVERAARTSGRWRGRSMRRPLCSAWATPTSQWPTHRRWSGLPA